MNTVESVDMSEFTSLMNEAQREVTRWYTSTNDSLEDYAKLGMLVENLHSRWQLLALVFNTTPETPPESSA